MAEAKFNAMGYLVTDPVLTQNAGDVYCKFRLAVKRERSDAIDYWLVTTWGRQAENCAKYLHKGSWIEIPQTKPAIIRNNPIEENGITYYAPEVIAEYVCFKKIG